MKMDVGAIDNNHAILQSLKLHIDDYNAYLLGQSAAIQELKQNLLQISAGNSRVLINGGIGTGKRAIAAYIHDNSQRNAQIFGILACGSVPADAIEETLFGKEDAHGKIITTGLLERSVGGTLLIDKIELLPINIQQKMARLLQQNIFKRLFGQENIKIDSRIIVTLGSDIDEAIKDNKLDRDFYERVSISEVNIPSLAERRVDIIELALNFSKKWALFHGVPQIKILQSALNIIQNYNWQGNLFALNNFMERLYLRDTANILQIVDDNMVNDLLYPASGTNLIQEMGGFLALPFRVAKESFEKHYLRYQLSRYDGNISQTAKFIGIDRVSLHRKIRMFNLTETDSTPSFSEQE